MALKKCQSLYSSARELYTTIFLMIDIVMLHSMEYGKYFVE